MGLGCVGLRARYIGRYIIWRGEAGRMWMFKVMLGTYICVRLNCSYACLQQCSKTIIERGKKIDWRPSRRLLLLLLHYIRQAEAE